MRVKIRHAKGLPGIKKGQRDIQIPAGKWAADRDIARCQEGEYYGIFPIILVNPPYHRPIQVIEPTPGRVREIGMFRDRNYPGKRTSPAVPGQ
jgi:hypothetical protein